MIGSSVALSAKVNEIVQDLKADLGISGYIPVIIGKIPHDYPGADTFNTTVSNAANNYAYIHFVNAGGLIMCDTSHFSADCYRTYGTRYGQAMINALGWYSLCFFENGRNMDPVAWDD